MTDIAKCIKVARAMRGLSQQELAKKTKKSPSYISYIESRDRTPSLETIDEIAFALDISTIFLLTLGSSDFWDDLIK